MSRPLSIYRVSPKSISQLEELRTQKKETKTKDFVLALFEYCIKNDTDSINRKELTTALSLHSRTDAKGKTVRFTITNKNIIRAVKELEAVDSLSISDDVLTIDEIDRKCKIYNLVNLNGFISFLNEEKKIKVGAPSKKKLTVRAESLDESEIVALDTRGGVTPYTEGAFSILESASRSKLEKNKIIECGYYIKRNDFVNIITTTSTNKDSEISLSSDQRVVHCLNGMLKKRNDEINSGPFNPRLNGSSAEIIGDYCYFDIYRLAEEMGYESNNQWARSNVIKMIKRLRDTTYEVDATHSLYWRENFMPNPAFNKATYQYILEYYSASDWEVKDNDDIDGSLIPEENDRYFVVKFHPQIYASMSKTGVAYISHDSMKSEKSDIVHRLYNWMKPVIGVRDKGFSKDHHRYPFDIFHQRVRSGSRLVNFETLFYKFIQRQNDDVLINTKPECVLFKYDDNGDVIPNGTVWLNGYYIKLEENEELAQEYYRKTRTHKAKRTKKYPMVTIWRDSLDDLIGDNSRHNLALRRQIKELEEGKQLTDKNTVMHSDIEDDLQRHNNV